MKHLLCNFGTSPAHGQDSQLLMSSEVAKRCQQEYLVSSLSVCACVSHRGWMGSHVLAHQCTPHQELLLPLNPTQGRWKSRTCKGMGLANTLKQHKPCNPGHGAVNSQRLKIKTSMVLQFKGNTE